MRRFACAFALVVCLAFLTSCGGGGASSNPPPPTPSPTPTSLIVSVTPGGSETNLVAIVMGSGGTPVSVTVTAQNGSAGTATMKVTGLPTGVVATPPTATVTLGQVQQVMLTATVNATVSTFKASVTASSGTTTASTPFLGRVDLPQESAVIGPSGGTLVGTSGTLAGVKLVVPPGALSENTAIQMKGVSASSFPPNSPGVFFTGNAVELLPSGLQFAFPAQLTLPFQDVDTDSVLDGSNMQVKTLSAAGLEQPGSSWSSLQCFADTNQGGVVCDIERFSTIFQQYSRFPSNANITYGFGVLPQGDGSDLYEGIGQALHTWERETKRSSIHFVPAESGATPDVFFTSGKLPCNVPARTGIPLFLCISYQSQQFKISCEVVFNSNLQCEKPYVWSGIRNAAVGTESIEAITLHEVGSHILNLGHSCRGCIFTSNENYKGEKGLDPVRDITADHADKDHPVYELGPGDIAAYRRHYGLLYAESGEGGGLTGSILYTVDPVPNGADVQVGSAPITLPDSSTPIITDVAQSPSDQHDAPVGQLYGVSMDSLYKIDNLTGAGELIGPLGSNGFNAMAFDRHGTLFGGSGLGEWAKIDVASGTAQILGSYGSGFGSSGDIVFVPGIFGIMPEQTYGTVLGGGYTNDQLVKIDAKSGHATRIMDLGTQSVFGLTWAGPALSGPWTPCLTGCRMKFFALTTDYTAGKGSLYLVDAGAGTWQFIRTLSFNAFGASAAQRRIH